MANSTGHICEKHGQYCDRSCINPNVDNGMMTKVWGPAGWLLMHCIAYGYPYAINPDNPDHITKKEDYYKFFYYLGRVFPCKYCRESYQKFLKELPLIDKLNTRRDLCKWVYDIHNKVNDKLGVPDNERPTFEEVDAKYEAFRAKCTGNKANNANVEGFNNTKDTKVVKPTGCVVPATGTSSRSIISITQNFEDVIVVSKSKLIGAFLAIVLIMIMVILLWKYRRVFRSL